MLQLRVELGGTPPGAVEEALLAAGAVSITLEDAGDAPIYEPGPGSEPLWPDTRLSALFDPDTDRDRVRAALAAALGSDTLPLYEFVMLPAREWTREWMAHFRPMRFGERLWVVPGTGPAPDPGACNILLDPGLAFGTGTHETTALCLEWLDADPGLPGCMLIDYGCGSGILAVAAAKLGARRVLAVDIDPQALLSTRMNAERNGVADRIDIRAPDALPEGWRGQRLVANILAAPLAGLAPLFRGLMEPGARFALAGLLERQTDEVRAAYAGWSEITDGGTLDGWTRLDGIKVD